MNEKELHEAATEAAIQEGIQGSCKISLEKKAGESTFQSHIEASAGPVALNALAILIVKFAEIVKLNPLEILSLLAVSLTTPRSERTEDKENEQSEA